MDAITFGEICSVLDSLSSMASPERWRQARGPLMEAWRTARERAEKADAEIARLTARVATADLLAEALTAHSADYLAGFRAGIEAAAKVAELSCTEAACAKIEARAQGDRQQMALTQECMETACDIASAIRAIQAPKGTP